MQQDLQPAAVDRASYPAREGNRVRVLIDGDETFRAIGERVHAARHSIWVTVAFVDLAMPAFGDASLMEALDHAAARGVDVRLLFWWSEFPGIGSFRGDAEELLELEERGVRIKMRWDHVPRGCHHQKSWVVDGDAAFVGGINLTPDGLSTQEHEADGHHDLFVEIEGPAVADVAENFAQRWNQASRFDAEGHAFPSADIAGSVDEIIPNPVHLGNSTVQVVRTIRRGLYEGMRGWSPDHRFDLAAGEHSVRDSIHRWIDAAESLVYVENQYLLAPDTLERLLHAATRGVDVIVVCPYTPDPNLVLYPEEHMLETLAALDLLGAEPRFGLFGLLRPGAGTVPIYVHAKLLIVDDRLLSVGSANHWPPSYDRDSELNACIWDTRIAASTRRRLWNEHLGERAAAAEAAESRLESWREIARHRGQGSRTVEIDPSAYYRFPSDLVAPWSGIEPKE